MIKRILAMALAATMVFGLVACGTKETKDDTDNTTVNQEQTQKDNETENEVEEPVGDGEITITDENVESIKEENEILVNYKMVKEEETTPDNRDAYHVIGEDGTEKYMLRTYECVDETGKTYEFILNYTDPENPDIFYMAALKDEEGNIYGQTHDNGMDVETKEGQMKVVKQDLYTQIEKFYMEKEMQENVDAMKSGDNGDSEGVEAGNSGAENSLAETDSENE